MIQERTEYKMGYIDELQDVIRHLHGGHAVHVESVPVKETFKGETVWEGIVEVFDLQGHPKANRVYAWAHETENPERPKRHVAVLHIDPVTSPLMAVRAAIREEIRNLGTAEAE
jgi:hypothetical protein